MPFASMWGRFTDLITSSPTMVPVDFAMMMTACRLVPAPEAFVHRATGEVLFPNKGTKQRKHTSPISPTICGRCVSPRVRLAVPKHHDGAAP